MARYIDADLLIKNIAKIEDLRTLSTKTIGEAISNTPTADVAEAKHGKWQLARRGRKIVCSRCETAVPYRKDDKRKYHLAWYSNYCPNCGAKMDGERKDT